MQYFSPGSGAFTERTIEPLGTAYYGHAWHVIAYCQLRQDYRDFRLDRMSKLVVRPVTATTSDRPSLTRYLEAHAATIEATLVKVQIDSSAAPAVQQQQYFFGFVAEIVQEASVERWFLVAQEEAFCRWLLMHGEAIISLSPPRLYDTLRTLVQQLAEHYRHRP